MKVVRFCLVISFFVNFIIVLEVVGLSVVVCLFNKISFGCCNVVINSVMVWCCFLDSKLIFEDKWFFKFKFSWVSCFLKNVWFCGLILWKKLCFFFCFIVRVRFFFIVKCMVVFSLGFWNMWLMDFECLIMDFFVIFFLFNKICFWLIENVLVMLFSKVDLFVLFLLMIVMKLLSFRERLIFFRIWFLLIVFFLKVWWRFFNVKMLFIWYYCFFFFEINGIFVEFVGKKDRLLVWK